ncbi:MAG: hypothetical protein Q4A10_07785 [Aerococcaceae bacterium]|nr:hypothetical protein [Aerococcaceae bacterium]
MLISKKVWRLSTVIALSLYAVMLGITIPHLQHLSQGIAIPDMLPGGYNITYINKLFETLGETGRDYYTYIQVPLDTIYPVAFSVMSINFIQHGIGSHIWAKKYMLIFPIISVVCDYTENISTLYSLINYPNLSATVIQISSVASLLKTVTVSFILIILVILAINALRKKLTKCNG